MSYIIRGQGNHPSRLDRSGWRYAIQTPGRKRPMKKTLFVAGAMLFAASALPAFAHEDYDYDHARDHREHYVEHQRLNEAHERAHEEGFESRAEHRAYHRALRDRHEDFHDDHHNTRHDHYRWWWNR